MTLASVINIVTTPQIVTKKLSACQNFHNDLPSLLCSCYVVIVGIRYVYQIDLVMCHVNHVRTGVSKKERIADIELV